MVIYGYLSLKNLFEERASSNEDVICTVTTQLITKDTNGKTYFYRHDSVEITKHFLIEKGEPITWDNFYDFFQKTMFLLLKETQNTINRDKMLLVKENRLIATRIIDEVQIIVE